MIRNPNPACLSAILFAAGIGLCPAQLRVDFNSTNQDGGPHNLAGFQTYQTAHEVAADFTAARPRSPWVFRTLMENRTRMLVAALHSNLWLSFNPGNCCLDLAWAGGMQLRRKVYNDSQLNPWVDGALYHRFPNAIIETTNEPNFPTGWTESPGSVSSVTLGTGVINPLRDKLANRWFKFDGTTTAVSATYDLSQNKEMVLFFEERRSVGTNWTRPSFTFGTVMPYGSNFTPVDQFFGIGGMDFLPDGRMVVSTWTLDGSNYGAVYIVNHYQDGNPATTTFTKFAEGPGEAFGLKVINGEIYVTQKREITKLIDTDGDGWCDEYIAIAHGWDSIPFTIPEAPVSAGDGPTEFVTFEFEAPAEPIMFFRVGTELEP